MLFCCCRRVLDDDVDVVRRQRLPSAVPGFLGRRRPEHQPAGLLVGLRTGSLYFSVRLRWFPHLACCAQGQRWHMNIENSENDFVCIWHGTVNVSRTIQLLLARLIQLTFSIVVSRLHISGVPSWNLPGAILKLCTLILDVYHLFKDHVDNY